MADEEKAKKTCGIVRPIAAWDGMPPDHWAEVQDIILEALGDDFETQVVSEADAVGVIHGRIVKNLNLMDLVICDLSGRNPNVMFEFGMRLAFDKPTIAIKDDVTEFSFDASPLEHMIYPRSLRYKTMEKFKDDLHRKALATANAPGTQGYQSFLEHFGPIQVASLNRVEVPAETIVLDQLADIRSLLNQVVAASPSRGVSFGNAETQGGLQRIEFSLDYFGDSRREEFVSQAAMVTGVREVAITRKKSHTYATVLYEDYHNGRGTAAILKSLFSALSSSSSTASTATTATSGRSHENASSAASAATSSMSSN